MELPWSYRRCILCLRDDVEMSRSHLVPQSLGGFVWAWTHCAACNNRVGSEIEAAVKRDDSIRHALERELAREIPEIAKSFAEGQRYLAQSDSGNLDASVQVARSNSERRGSTSRSSRIKRALDSQSRR